MTRRFCDVCGIEIKRNYVSDRLKGSARLRRGDNRVGKDVLFEVTLGIGSTWNQGDICLHCLLDAIENCDDRPKAAVA